MVATTASSTSGKVTMLSLTTPLVPEIQRLVGGRSLRSPTAALTRVLVVERCCSTTEVPIPQLALRPFCSTPPEYSTPPPERMQWSRTTPGLGTLRSAVMRSQATWTETSIAPLAKQLLAGTFPE